MDDKRKIEDRILNIISYIDQDQMMKPLIWSLKLFSLEELLQLKDFLENWDYKPIYLLVDSKIKEYLSIIEEIKQVKIWSKMSEVKQKETNERLEESTRIEKMLIF
jgi:hypothetical protein